MKLGPLLIGLAKTKEPLTKEQLTTQLARVTTSYYRQYFGREPTLSDIYEMRQDPTIKIGLSVIKQPLQRVEWDITAMPGARQKLPEDIKHFVEDNLRPLWDEFMVNLLTGIDFGRAVFEKVWEDRGGKLYYKKLLSLRLDNLKLYYDRVTGEFTRVKQVNPPVGKQKKDQTAEIPAEKLFVYTHKKEFGDVEGESRLVGVYPYWLICNDIYKYANNFYHRFGIPTTRGWAPRGQTPVGTDANGNPVEQDNMVWWQSVLDNIHTNTTLVHEYDPDNRFGFEFLEPKHAEARFLPYIEHLNTMKLVALFVPELTVMKGVRGSYALGRAQQELFIDNMEAILKEINGQVDEYLIKPLIQINFGTDAPMAHWSYQPMSKQVRDYAAKAFEFVTMGLANRGIVKIDYDAVAERFGIPTLPEPEEFAPPTNPEGLEEDAKLTDALRGLVGLGKVLPQSPIKIEEPVEDSEVVLAEKTIAQWRSRVDKLSGKLAKEMGGIYDAQAQALLLKVKNILPLRETGNVGAKIRKLTIPSVAKLSNLLYSYMLEAFDLGKRSAADEKKEIEYERAVPDSVRSMLRARADAVADRHANDLLYLTDITVLDNLYENVTNKDIIGMLMTEFDNFKSKKLGVTSRHELMKSFNDARSYVADKHIVR